MRILSHSIIVSFLKVPPFLFGALVYSFYSQVELIIIIIYHVRTTANVAAVCNCYYYDRAVHISVAVDMRTLLDRKTFSSITNGQVAARSSDWAYYQKALIIPTRQHDIGAYK